ncbi:MAG TPA: hypothetical protein VEL74_08835 [Thermoanaerobaculia bacterium]|nr:hypothetical protein [Thermoanaerobaculia bacterium]
MAPLLLRRLTLSAALLTLAACGSSEEAELDVAPPLATARISSYTGWFPGPWRQEIWIRLDEGVELSEVAQLSVFGKLRPGMSLGEAVAVAGRPAGQSTDPRGTRWSHWFSGSDSVQVGCVESCSGDDCFSSWELRAQGSGLSPEGIFIPAIVEILQQAEASRPKVGYRAIHVATQDASHRLTLELPSRRGRALSWGGEMAPCESPKGTSAPGRAASGG